ncbi:MAG: replication initiator protein A [Lachnospiraceae bacterium]|nr:replication initiator protein A [Lachnospiraceae bacterium]
MRYITKIEEKKQIPYFQYPKFLLELQLSQNAKLLYMLLYDRARISQKNKWMDEQGRVFAVFPIAELSEKMGKCRSSVKNALKELEDAGWIVRKFSGFSKPKHIYVLIPDEKALCAGEARKWPAINATANEAEKEPSDGYRCGLSNGINMAPSKVNKKEEFNNTSGTTQRIQEKRVKLKSVDYDCEEEESL